MPRTLDPKGGGRRRRPAARPAGAAEQTIRGRVAGCLVLLAMAITITAQAAPQTYEDEKLRVDVPEGWLARPAKMGGVPGVALTNIPEAELVAIEEAKRTVGPGEVIVHIMEVGAMGPSAAEAYGLTPASNGEDYVKGYARLYRSGRPGLRATKPTTVRIGGKKLAFTEAELDRFQYTMRQYGWEEYAIGVTTHRGEADRFEDSIRGILSSLERRRAEEVP